MSKLQAIILAGGKGTRLAPLTDHLPKPLVPVRGKAMIRYVLEHLQRAGIVRVAISTAHLGHLIQEQLGDGAALGMSLSYLQEPEPMGTAGWTRLVDWDSLDDQFLVLNADNLFWIDIAQFFARHRDTEALATIAAIQLPSNSVSAAELLVGNDARTHLERYVDRTEAHQFIGASPSVLISSGWYVMSPHVRNHVPDVTPVSHELHVWPALAASGQPIGLYQAVEPWFDSGTHERLARVEQFLNDNPGYAA